MNRIEGFDSQPYLVIHSLIPYCLISGEATHFVFFFGFLDIDFLSRRSRGKIHGAWMEALYVEVVKDGLSVSEMMKLLDQALSRELTQYD